MLCATVVQHRLCTHIEAIYVLMTVFCLEAPVAKELKYAVLTVPTYKLQGLHALVVDIYIVGYL